MKTFVFVTDHPGKDKYSTVLFLKHLYAVEIPQDRCIEKEIIWSDGPSEFKNQYSRHALQELSELYGKEFAWKFFATSHGKGVVDGVGGSLKSYVRRRVLSPGENAPIVDNAVSFFNAVKHNAKTTVIHIPTGDKNTTKR